MNNSDIKIYKIDLFKKRFGYGDNVDYYGPKKELSKIFNIQKFKFNDDLIDNYFDLL